MPLVELVHTDADVRECQALRFQVYCRERAFLQSEDYPSEIEADPWDEMATHLIAVSDGALVGTARMIHHSKLGFPLERYCSVSIPPEIVPHTAEVSRLAVLRRSQILPAGQGWGMEGGLARKVALKLFQKVYVTAKQHKRTHLVASMAPALTRVLRSYDIPLKAIGPAVDFGGWVIPFLISLEGFDEITTAAAIRFRTAVNSNSPPSDLESTSLNSRSVAGQA